MSLKTKTTAGVLAAMIAITGCSAAETASRNTSRAADNFEVNRRIVFLNGITDSYLLTIEGLCSIEEDTVGGVSQLEVTCLVGDDEFKKHYLGLSDNVSYFVEQLEPIEADPYHYRVIFRPETIVPDIELDVS